MAREKSDWKIARNIGKRIRDLRDHMDWTQSQLGDIMGVRWDTVSKWENSRTRPPLSRLQRAVSMYGFPAEIFKEGGRLPSAVLAESPVSPKLADGDNGEVVAPALKPNPDEGASSAALEFKRAAAQYLARGEDMPLGEVLQWVDRIVEDAIGKRPRLHERRKHR